MATYNTYTPRQNTGPSAADQQAAWDLWQRRGSWGLQGGEDDLSPAAQAALAQIRQFAGNDPRSVMRNADGSLSRRNGPLSVSRMGFGGGPMSAEDEARDRYMRTTYGMGDDVMNDPRLDAAMNALSSRLDPGSTRDALFSQATDATAQQAQSLAGNLRESMSRLGMTPDDPSVAARLRQIETARMQQNNAARTSATLAGQQDASAAASQLAQQRLSQYGMAGNYYGAGNQYDAGQRFNQTYTAPQLQSPVAPTAAARPAWQPPAQPVAAPAPVAQPAAKPAAAPAVSTRRDFVPLPGSAMTISAAPRPSTARVGMAPATNAWTAAGFGAGSAAADAAMAALRPAASRKPGTY